MVLSRRQPNHKTRFEPLMGAINRVNTKCTIIWHWNSPIAEARHKFFEINALYKMKEDYVEAISYGKSQRAE